MIYLSIEVVFRYCWDVVGVCSNEGLIRNLGSSLGINTCLDPLQCSVPWMISNHSEIAQRAVKEFYFKDKITNTSLSNVGANANFSLDVNEKLF